VSVHCGAGRLLPSPPRSPCKGWPLELKSDLSGVPELYLETLRLAKTGQTLSAPIPRAINNLSAALSSQEHKKISLEKKSAKT